MSVGSLHLEDSTASDPDTAQVFLFSSHPRVVDTIGPVSPAGPTVARKVRILKCSGIRISNRLHFRMIIKMNPKNMKLYKNFLALTSGLCISQMLQSV